MAQIQVFSTTTLFLYLIALSLFHFADSKPVGFSLKMIPRDSPESPFYPGNITQREKIQRLVEFSKDRYSHLESISNLNGTIDPDNIHFKVVRKGFFYLVKVYLGTPKFSAILIMDTGSGLIWTQCKPCRNCFPQSGEMFDPSRSVTYRRLPCEHHLCSPPYRCVNGICGYRLRYEGGAQTKGIVSQEKFWFPYNQGTLYPIQNMAFGCSMDNQGFSFDPTHLASGILGLNMAQISLVGQLSQLINSRFSYCLVPSTSMAASSVLRFGEDIVVRGGNVQTTPFVRQTISENYHLSLLDISVAGQPMGFEPGTFAIKPDGTGGTVIDTGSALTFIVRNAYQQVINAFEQYFLAFHRNRVHDVPGDLDLCYFYDQTFHDYAPMTFHFQGADFHVDPKYVYFFDAASTYFCVALLPSDGKTILGAFQQQNTRFIYDGNIGGIRFVPEDCTLDQY